MATSGASQVTGDRWLILSQQGEPVEEPDDPQLTPPVSAAISSTAGDGQVEDSTQQRTDTAAEALSRTRTPPSTPVNGLPAAPQQQIVSVVQSSYKDRFWKCCCSCWPQQPKHTRMDPAD